MAGHQVIWDLLAAADLIVTAGFDPVELITPWRLPVPVLHVDTVPNTDQVYPAAHRGRRQRGGRAVVAARVRDEAAALVGGGGGGAPAGAARGA